MACKLAMQCNLLYGFLKCALPEDMIDVDLKVQTLKGINTYKKDYNPKPPNVALEKQRHNLPLPKEENGKVHVSKASNNFLLYYQALPFQT